MCLVIQARNRKPSKIISVVIKSMKGYYVANKYSIFVPYLTKELQPKEIDC